MRKIAVYFKGRSFARGLSLTMYQITIQYFLDCATDIKAFSKKFVYHLALIFQGFLCRNHSNANEKYVLVELSGL